MKDAVPIISNAMLVGDKAKFLAMLLTLKVRENRVGIHLCCSVRLVPVRKLIVTHSYSAFRDRRHRGVRLIVAELQAAVETVQKNEPCHLISRWGGSAAQGSSPSLYHTGQKETEVNNLKVRLKKETLLLFLPIFSISQSSLDSNELSVIFFRDAGVKLQSDTAVVACPDSWPETLQAAGLSGQW